MTFIFLNFKPSDTIPFVAMQSAMGVTAKNKTNIVHDQQIPWQHKRHVFSHIRRSKISPKQNSIYLS